jgi:hypothetical protein
VSVDVPGGRSDDHAAERQVEPQGVAGFERDAPEDKRADGDSGNAGSSMTPSVRQMTCLRQICTGTTVVGSRSRPAPASRGFDRQVEKEMTKAQ